MAHISFALLQARIAGASVTDIADRLQLPETWVEERTEAACLCVVLTNAIGGLIA
jgi:hypothetical protein